VLFIKFIDSLIRWRFLSVWFIYLFYIKDNKSFWLCINPSSKSSLERGFKHSHIIHTCFTLQ